MNANKKRALIFIIQLSITLCWIITSLEAQTNKEKKTNGEKNIQKHWTGTLNTTLNVYNNIPPRKQDESASIYTLNAKKEGGKKQNWNPFHM